MVKKWNVRIPQLSGTDTRRVYLYLPDLYDEEPDRRFPVMYMFDGHNVFFDSDATFGKSWGMNRYMSMTRTPLIIVAGSGVKIQPAKAVQIYLHPGVGVFPGDQRLAVFIRNG